MSCFANRAVAIFAAACIGLGSRAEVGETLGAPSAEKCGTEIPRFALLGLIDVDQDGKSDLETIRQLIKQNGGAIDAELGVDGGLTGALRRDTGCIVVGELPDKTSVSPLVARRFDAFLRRATEWNIPVVPIDELLQSGTRRTVPQDDNGLRFRPRRPPPVRRGGY